MSELAVDTAALLAEAARRASCYLGGLEGRFVAPSSEAIAALAELDVPLPEGPCAPSLILDELDRLISPATMAMAGPRYFGFVIGGALPATLAASVLAAAWDQNSAKSIMAPGTAELERIALRWVIDALGLPATVSGGFVTGATMASFTALAAARHAVLARAGWDVEARGLFGAPPITVVVGIEAHASVLKALAMLGLGRERVIRVSVDSQGRIDPNGIPTPRGPTIVCLQAGNVNSGAFDPAVPTIANAHRDSAWVHVDGAFGLWAAAAPARSYLTAGLAEADSWATDLHKWLNVPYDSGLALVRDETALRAAMSISAAYLPDGGMRDPADFTPELSRRARGVEVWAALRSLGRSGLADLVERNCRYAHRFAEGLSAAGHRVLNDVVLNQVLVSFGSDERTRQVIDAVQADGTCWCGGTVWRGQTAMRISVSSWATTENDIERSLAAILNVARG